MKVFVSVCASLLVLFLFAGMMTSQTQAQENIAIVVSPHTLNLASSGLCVTVHAEIPYLLVDSSSVTLTVTDTNVQVEPTSIFADNRGDLVAKFDIVEIKDNVEPGDVVLTLSGTTVAGEAFAGTDEITVIDKPVQTPATRSLQLRWIWRQIGL